MKTKLKVSVLGCGYVGLTAALGFSQYGHDVMATDVDSKRITLLQSGKSPIQEPDFDWLLEQTPEEREDFYLGTLTFSAHQVDTITFGDVIIIAVGTPEANTNTGLDTSYVRGALISVLNVAYHQGLSKTIVVKSTLPVGEMRKLNHLVDEYGLTERITLLFNPEFLQEGRAYYDFTYPSRVVIGTPDGKRNEVAEQLYSVLDYAKVVFTDYESAELSKLASNAMLATRISFMNELAKLTDHYGGNIDDVAKIMGMDKRIGPDFLKAGLGWGGSCFPKDVHALTVAGRSAGINCSIVSAAHRANDAQLAYARIKVVDAYTDAERNDIVFGVWGLSFKPGTGDLRESPAAKLLEELTACFRNVHFKIYDPSGVPAPNKPQYVTACETALEATIDVDGLLVLTDWPEFKDYDPSPLMLTMRKRKVFDFRNCLPSSFKELGFEYTTIGKNNLAK